MKLLNILLIYAVTFFLFSCERIKLTVTNGNGSGSYAPKSAVSIKAHLPNPGYEFSEWSGDTKYIEDISKKETKVILPEINKDETLEIKIKANYMVDPSALEYNLLIENGTGSGHYLTYSVVTISANPPLEGYQFDKWTGDIKYLNNPYLATQKIVIAKEDISLTATYKIKVTPTIIPTIIPTPIPTPTPNPNAPLRLMMIGDSITHSSYGTGDVRCELWWRLQNMTITFDFVGSENGFNGGGGSGNCDNDHEAHWGWTADRILQILPESAQQHKPDIAVIHIGTNDIRSGHSNSSTVDEIRMMIDILRAQNPALVVFVAGLIPNYKDNTHSQTNDLNNQVKNFASGYSTSSNPIIYVDQNSGFGPEDLADKIHPNQSGSRKMADKWEIAIKNYYSK